MLRRVRPNGFGGGRSAGFTAGSGRMTDWVVTGEAAEDERNGRAGGTQFRRDETGPGTK